MTKYLLEVIKEHNMGTIRDYKVYSNRLKAEEDYHKNLLNLCDENGYDYNLIIADTEEGADYRAEYGIYTDDVLTNNKLIGYVGACEFGVALYEVEEE